MPWCCGTRPIMRQGNSSVCGCGTAGQNSSNVVSRAILKRYSCNCCRGKQNACRRVPATVFFLGRSEMQAIRIHEYGNAGKLQLEEIPRLQVTDDQILVRVRDAGVNPIDWKI